MGCPDCGRHRRKRFDEHPFQEKPFNFLDALKGVVTNNANYVASEVADARTKVCLECPKFRPALRNCMECSCFIDLKVLFEESSCPLERW